MPPAPPPLSQPLAPAAQPRASRITPSRRPRARASSPLIHSPPCRGCLSAGDSDAAPAIDFERHSGQELGLVGGEIERRVRDVLRLGEPAERDAGREAGAML